MKSSKFDSQTKEHHESGAISFEEALVMTKFGKFNYALILLSGVCLTTVLLETLGISFVLPIAECDLQLTTQGKGILSAIGFAGIISSSHLWGFLADTKGRKRVIQPTLLLAFLCTLLSSLVTNFWLFVLLRYLNGFFISGCSATVYAYLGEFHCFKNRSRAILMASSIFGIGCMTLPLIGWLIINQEFIFVIPIIETVYKPWRLFILVCGLPSLICGLVLFKIPESPKFVLGLGEQEKAIAILQKIYVVNGGKKDEFNIKSIIEENDSTSLKQMLNKNSKSPFSIFKSMWIQTSPLFSKRYLKNILLACTLQFGIFATSNGMYMWFPEILNKMVEFMEANPHNHSTICEISSASRINIQQNLQISNIVCNEKLEISTFEHTLILEAVYAIGFAFIGLIISKIGKIPILLFILISCGICGVITVFTTLPILSIYFYICLLSCGLAIPIVNAATIEVFPTNLRAMAVCLSLMFGRLGSVIGAILVGILLDYNCSATFLLSGISLIGCAFLALFIPNTNKRNPEIKISTVSA